MAVSQHTMRIELPGNSAGLRERQWEKLKRLLVKVGTTENFNSQRLHQHGVDPYSITSLEDFTQRVPFTTKADLLQDRLLYPPFGSNFTEPLERYTRFCQTSGTQTGTPMAVLDTPASWESMLSCWRQVYRAAGVQAGERIFFAFSFGPFLGFWTAFEAAARDCLVIPGGGQSTNARLEMMARYKATVLCCTPTYALRLGENIGAPSGVSLDQLNVRRIIVAGEPGGSIPIVRERLNELWGGVKIFDHHGLSEIGPVSYEDAAQPSSLCVIEDAYFAEVLDPNTGLPVEEGEEGELVLTTLDRSSCPLIRYCTGDWVAPHRVEDKLYLEGGVLGRVDDMAVIRGVNIYPSALENVIRRFPEIAEFQVEQRKVEAMDEIDLIVELAPGADDAVIPKLQERLRDTFSLRIPVRLAAQGSLPRFDFKSRRWRKVP
jgi:phenylacetate-CoA ligase